MSARTLAVALAVTALVAPAATHACAVCGAGGDPNRASFLWTTVLLSLLPLALIGGGVWFLRRAARAAEAAAPAAADAPLTPTTPRT